MRVFVLADTYKVYLDWCAMRRVHPRAAECVTNPRSLRGKIKANDMVMDARLVKDPTARQQQVA